MVTVWKAEEWNGVAQLWEQLRHPRGLALVIGIGIGIERRRGSILF